MPEFSLVQNTGIQIVKLKDDLVLDLSDPVRGLRFSEFQFSNRTFIDLAYLFPNRQKALRRNDLFQAGYIMDLEKNILAPEEDLNDNMRWLDPEELTSVSNLNMPMGLDRRPALTSIEGKWIPLPYYLRVPYGRYTTPTNWVRIKLLPQAEKSTESKRVYTVLFAVDTDEYPFDSEPEYKDNTPHLGANPEKTYSLCGISWDDLELLNEKDREHAVRMVVPLRAFDICDSRSAKKNRWLCDYLADLFNLPSEKDLGLLPEGRRLRHIAFYVGLVATLHRTRMLPDIRLFTSKDREVINTTLVLDVGNSRSFGLLAEDPLDSSFSKCSTLALRDLETGAVYDEPFDMRLCFKDERFGVSDTPQFQWPSILRLGKEGLRNIYGNEEDLVSNELFDTNHSSPKRFLWDSEPINGQWKFISQRDHRVGQSMTVNKIGLLEQFGTDGSFICDPAMMADKRRYSRASLMTFCFIEILLHARMQANSIEYRTKNGNESLRRVISRIIVTCPTAMPKSEQYTLRKSMEDACAAISRFYPVNERKWEEPYDPEADREKVEVIPSSKELKLTQDNVEFRKNWNYDEATCCQMVYLYSQCRRYLGGIDEFFNIYGRRRNGETRKSLTLASIDIGAGTTDVMIANYSNVGESIQPKPLFWDSFHLAGDDLMKRIILESLLDFENKNYPGASGIISAKLRSIGCTDVANRMHHFFDDTNAMGVIEKRMRKEFNIQVLSPIAAKLLDKLQKNEPDCTLRYDDIFTENRPAQSLMDFFAQQMGFRFEEIEIGFNKQFLNELVCKTFELSFRKFAAIFSSYKCDVVLMGGRPSSLEQVNRLLRRLYPVAPNRLVSMNDFRVGNWYPNSSDTGEFGDRKSLVAVGALLSYMGECGKLFDFRLTTGKLRDGVNATSDFIGLFNSNNGALSNVLTPETATGRLEISSFPVILGSKQIDVPGYPSQMLMKLDFNEKRMRAIAEMKLRQKLGADTKLSPDMITSEVNVMKFQARRSSPLIFTLVRDFYENKEDVKIDCVENAEHEELNSNFFCLSPQSWSEDESNWLDSGCFILNIH